MLRSAWLLSVMCAVALPVWADTPVVDQRESNQRERIAAGVNAGELTRPETRRLVHAERNLQRHEAAAKADGVVTARERHSLRHHARDVSKRIAVQKHDGQARPK